VEAEPRGSAVIDFGIDAVAITTEYRYRVWRWMDSVFFADLGQVYGDLASEIGDNRYDPRSAPV
jgi:hypothetical protein